MVESLLAARATVDNVGTLQYSDEASNSLVFKRVRIEGVVSKPELNGMCGKCMAFDVAQGRYAVMLDADREKFERGERVAPVALKP